MRSIKSEANDVQVTVTEIRTKQFETEKHIEKENLLLQQSLAERKGEQTTLQNKSDQPVYQGLSKCYIFTSKIYRFK